jgi:hypothetical protein
LILITRRKHNIGEVTDTVGESISENCGIFDLLRQVHDEDSVLPYYDQYHVNNDFDLVEAIYKEDCDTTGNLWGGQWFRDLRMRCVMNPEYTERCLESPAFWDMKDEILEYLENA